jgi:hypothetical protein
MRLLKKKDALFIAAGILLLLAPFSVFAEGLKGQLYLTPGVEKHRLLVKFRASAGAALNADRTLVLRRGIPAAETKAWQDAIALKYRRVVPFTPPAPLLPGRPDMSGCSGMMYADVPDTDGDRLLALGRELEELDEVEYCSLEPLQGPPPPAADIAPATPDFTGQQGWLGPDPGCDFRYAWTVNAAGKGVTVRDIEDSWGALDHEDFSPSLPDVAYVLDRYSDTYAYHGISIFGMIFAQHNGYGVDGGAPGASGRCYSFQTSATTQDRPAAMARMVADSKQGEVILLEMQAYGPDGNLCPADISQTIWDLTKTATDSGIIVVATAGNGGANMDASPYAAYLARGDNGVIMVGAGSANTSHTRLSFSSYGSPVHVQGWGQNVVTASLGSNADLADLPSGSPDSMQGYTSVFNGTSSAGGMVAAAAAVLQSYAVSTLGRDLAPREIRTILIATGIPQGAGIAGHIGPLPDLKAAISLLDSLYKTEVLPQNLENAPGPNSLFCSNGVIHYRVPCFSSSSCAVHVTLSLFNLKGSLITTLLNGQKSPGRYTITAQKANGAERLSSGIYLCTLRVNGTGYSTGIVVR